MINSRFGLSVLISALALASCGEQTSKEKADTALAVKIVSDTLSKKETKLPQQFTQDAIGAFYVLGDRDAGTTDEKKISKWLFPFLQQLDAHGINPEENLFQNGTGPMGAQFNPEADLLIAGYLNGVIDTSTVVCAVNDFRIVNVHFEKSDSTRNNHTLCWFILPQRTLNVGRHVPSEKEKNEICAMKGIQEKDWVDNLCSVLKFSITAKAEKEEIHLRNYFLMTFDK